MAGTYSGRVCGSLFCTCPLALVLREVIEDVGVCKGVRPSVRVRKCVCVQGVVGGRKDGKINLSSRRGEAKVGWLFKSQPLTCVPIKVVAIDASCSTLSTMERYPHIGFMHHLQTREELKLTVAASIIPASVGRRPAARCPAFFFFFFFFPRRDILYNFITVALCLG